MFHIVLVNPEIPPNTGNIIRLAANTGCSLHLIEPLGFSMDDKHMRRAGLDYHEYAQVSRYANWSTFLELQKPATDRLFAMTTKAQQPLFDVVFKDGDYFVFGSETQGLSQAMRDTFMPEQQIKLPMLPTQRSLNLSNTVAVTVYEAWRQIAFAKK
ncbi:MAG TPA: tRNA (uridine(34)/cytosine(34)/5-carboxymethylaminomethyluridine(34)-2'-O)-methyltransferase TrmL [Burkholderiaceae bacterium]|nr:tRNA (uridine(34)/cytosine(34)/5-carboxymethylaminomethyluridine(34)-2'-O)-methyltransferase TrmL [Burkholderiaceae bacterium]